MKRQGKVPLCREGGVRERKLRTRAVSSHYSAINWLDFSSMREAVKEVSAVGYERGYCVMVGEGYIALGDICKYENVIVLFVPRT